MKRTSIFLAEQDRQSIEVIKERYGLSTDSDAVRLALRVLAESPMLNIERGDSHERADDIR